MDESGSAVQSRQDTTEIGPRLETWKQIASYLKRDVRTVQRWEKTEGLPVHRHLHTKVATVYADRTEVDQWWSQRRPQLEEQEAAPRSEAAPQVERRLMAPWALPAIAALIALAGSLWWFGPPSAAQTSTRRIWTGPDPDHFGGVSPDGRWLAVVDKDTEDLALVELATGRQRRLTRKPPRARTGSARFPIFSPDGSRVLYGWNEGARFTVRLIHEDGSGERVLFDAPSAQDLEPLAWSPGGGKAAILIREVGRCRILELDIASGSHRQLISLSGGAPWGAAYSPDGQWLAYDFDRSVSDSAQRDIFLIPTAGGVPRTLIGHAGNDVLLGWAPDGRLLYACDRRGGVDAWTIEVSAGAARSEPVLAVNGLGDVWPLGFRRDGAFYYGVPTAVTDVYTAPFDFVAGKPLAAARPASDRFAGVNTSPDWSPDGSLLAYVPFRRRKVPWPSARAILRKLETGRERLIPIPMEAVEMQRWCPDGRSLLATGHTESNAFALVRVDIASGEMRFVAASRETGIGYHEPVCLPGGKQVLYKRRLGFMEPAPLVSLDLATNRETQMLPSVYRLALSRDGLRLAYSTFDDEREYIRVVSLAGPRPEEVFSEPRSGRIVSVAWSPDERSILFAKRGRLWRVKVDGGKAEELPLSAEALRELRVHPDGTRIAFTAGSTAKGEVWALENLAVR